MTPPDTIRLYGTAPDSIVDGPGLRYAVFVQGCSHGCPGCHNPDSQPCAGGTVRAIACAALARQVRELGLDVWTYSGYRYEQLAEGIPDPAARDLLDQTDVLVDGPFVQAQHSYQLPWRGSHNQRLIDVPATRARGRIVLWETHEDFPVKPPSW